MKLNRQCVGATGTRMKVQCYDVLVILMAWVSSSASTGIRRQLPNTPPHVGVLPLPQKECKCETVPGSHSHPLSHSVPLLALSPPPLPALPLHCHAQKCHVLFHGYLPTLPCTLLIRCSTAARFWETGAGSRKQGLPGSRAVEGRNGRAETPGGSLKYLPTSPAAAQQRL
jgi:hypothetical protein